MVLPELSGSEKCWGEKGYLMSHITAFATVKNTSILQVRKLKLRQAHYLI